MPIWYLLFAFVAPLYDRMTSVLGVPSFSSMCLSYVHGTKVQSQSLCLQAFHDLAAGPTMSARILSVDDSGVIVVTLEVRMEEGVILTAKEELFLKLSFV